MNRNISFGMLKLMLAMIMGVFISAFSFGTVTVHAIEVTGEEYVIIEDEPVPLDETPEDADASAAFVILFGGMLLIIIAVVVSVVATVASIAPVVDEVL